MRLFFFFVMRKVFPCAITAQVSRTCPFCFLGEVIQESRLLSRLRKTSWTKNRRWKRFPGTKDEKDFWVIWTYRNCVKSCCPKVYLIVIALLLMGIRFRGNAGQIHFHFWMTVFVDFFWILVIKHRASTWHKSIS